MNTEMETIRPHVLACLEKYADQDDKLLAEVDNLARKRGNSTYSVFFNILTHLDFAPELAERFWRQILPHAAQISAALGRPVSVRTAVCDFFCSVYKALHNPSLIEIQLFEKTDKSSKYDNLTGLFNRNFLDEALEREIGRAKRHHTELSILFFDLDDFKKLNDTYGHLAGDEVLRQVAAIIKHEKRNEDIAARYGGEEIAIIAPETGKMNGLVLAERIREKVRRMSVAYGEQVIRLTVSGGVAAFPADALDGSTLLENADHALYRAKSSGKNTVSLFSQDKRRYTRTDFVDQIRLKKLGFDDPIGPLTVRSKNISEGGVLLESNLPFDVGTRTQLNIPLRPDQPSLFIGVVVRTTSQGANRHEIGVSFLDLDQNTKKDIIRFLAVRNGEVGRSSDEIRPARFREPETRALLESIPEINTAAK